MHVLVDVLEQLATGVVQAGADLHVHFGLPSPERRVDQPDALQLGGLVYQDDRLRALGAVAALPRWRGIGFDGVGVLSQKRQQLCRRQRHVKAMCRKFLNLTTC